MTYGRYMKKLATSGLLIAQAGLLAVLVASSISESRAQGQGRRILLTIGVAEYASLGRLANPVRDERAAADLGTKHGFIVMSSRNPSEIDLRSKLRELTRQCAKAELCMVMYYGHGGVIGKSGAQVLAPAD